MMKIIADRFTSQLLILTFSLLSAFASSQSTTLLAQEIPWEFAPYRMQYWLSIDPALTFSDAQRELLIESLSTQTELVYDAAARIKTQITPRSLMSRVLREIDVFSIQAILDSEMTLVISKLGENAKEIRTFENVLEKSTVITISELNASSTIREMQDHLADPKWKQFSEKITTTKDTMPEMVEKIKAGTVAAALIRRSEVPMLGRNARVVPIRFPWQLDSLMRTSDKIFVVAITAEMEKTTVQIREIDCTLRVVGPIVQCSAASFESIPRAIAYATQRAFAPMARVEDAEVKTATMRIRAGGLLPEEPHPARMVPGDVLIPYVRRDDRNGAPTLLQSLPWTYIAITSGDDVNVNAAIFSGMRGALAGRKTKRTQKIGLKARPMFESTDLQLNVQLKPELRVAGAEVYRRTPGSDDLVLVGRSDWRGVVNIKELQSPIAFYEKPVSKNSESGKSSTKETEKATAASTSPTTAISPLPTTNTSNTAAKPKRLLSDKPTSVTDNQTIEQFVSLLNERSRGDDVLFAWDLLPLAKQNEIESLIESLSQKITPKTFAPIANLRKQLVELLRDKSTFIVSSSALKEFSPPGTPSIQEKDVRSAADLLETIVPSSLLEGKWQLKKGELRSVFYVYFANVFRMLDEKGFGDGITKASGLYSLKTSSGDSATITTISAPGMPPQEIELTRSEGRWLPKALVAQWPMVLDIAKAQINSFDEKQIIQSQTTISLMAGGILQSLKNAKDQAAFDDAIKQIILSLNIDPAAIKNNPIAMAAASNAGAPGSTSGTSSSTPGTNAAVPTASAEAKTPKEEVQLNYPLYLYYIKNGNTVLARLPLLTGISQNEIADLPDDRRRLETEAFLKGIQGEVLDIVARRQILLKRALDYLGIGKKSEAEGLLKELRGEKTYEMMSEDLDSLQRRILSPDREPVTPGTEQRISKMFDQTRQILQKYLQDTIVRDLEVKLR